MKQVYFKLILLTAVVIFFGLLHGLSSNREQTGLSILQVTNYDLIEGQHLSDILVNANNNFQLEKEVVAKGKLFLKLYIPEEYRVSGGISIKGRLKIENVFQTDSAGILKSITAHWHGFNDKSLSLNQAYYRCVGNEDYIYVLISNDSDVTTQLKEITWLTEEQLSGMILSQFTEEFLLLAIVSFLIIVFAIISLVHRRKKHLYYFLGLVSILAYSFYLFDIETNERVKDLLIRSFGLSMLFNYVFIIENISDYLNEQQRKIAAVGLNSLVVISALSILSVVFNFWYFFSMELFVWAVMLIAGSIFFLSVNSRVKSVDKLLIFKIMVFNITMLIMISQYFNAISHDYLRIFLCGIIMKEIILSAYYIKRISILKTADKRKLDFIKKLKGDYNEEMYTKNFLKTELQNTEEKIVQNTMMIEDKERLIIDLEKMLKSNLDAFSMAKVRPIINKIQEVEKHIGIKQFDFHFQRVNQELFDKLQHNFPQLTANDLKLCAFIRMNLNSKEIAAITGKSPSSVDVSRFRLRKKLSVESNSDLLVLLSASLNENIAS
ncbi:hypothetical protein QUH73_18600 [Labilibaculum sp. K2S]|uniref:helix-turn-helix transcriptional regulator n=1 Tax=Labilibaculum sp. K2S TaxID=3056386 RepID=UPI0025A3AF25|nr:hypothetical protein [Labilibaculum sp. K2S]MDM8161833.1 hypothetical protein [Labilibaculum sp. K2S]